MFDIICRDFAYVARDRMTRMHMCHVFQCDTPARQIANTLRDICKRIMQERGLQPAHPTTQRRPTDLPNLEKLGQPPGSTPPSSLFNSEIIHQASFQQICFWLSLAFPLQHHLSPSAVFPLLLCISCLQVLIWCRYAIWMSIMMRHTCTISPTCSSTCVVHILSPILLLSFTNMLSGTWYPVIFCSC